MIKGLSKRLLRRAFILRVFILIVLISPLLPAPLRLPQAKAGPIIVGNGAGLSEFYLLYGLRNYSSLLDSCILLRGCSSGIESKLLTLSQAKFSEKTEIDFLTSEELGETLWREKQASPAKPIHIEVNKDLLFIIKSGQKTPWGLSEGVRFLTQVWAGKLNWSEADTELVATRLSKLAAIEKLRSSYSEVALRHISFALMSLPNSRLIIEDEASAYEIPFSNLLSCLHSTGVDVRPSSTQILNANWGTASFPTIDKALMMITGRIQYHCALESGGTSREFVSSYFATFLVEEASPKPTIDPTSFKLEQHGIK